MSRYLSATTLLYLFLSTQCLAQTWQVAFQKVETAYNQQRYADGLEESEIALLLAEKEFGPNAMQYAQTLTMKGIFYQLLNQNELAEPVLTKATGIYKKVFGEKDLNYAKSNLNLATTEKALGHFVSSEEHYKIALGIFYTQWGESVDYSGYSLYLAQLYEAILEFDKAEEIYQRVLRNYEQKLGKNNENYGHTLFYLAQVYEKSIRYVEAESYYKKVIETYKSALGENSFYYASALNYLGHLYHLSGDYVQSEHYYLLALEKAKVTIGENHEYYATYLNNIGNLYQHMGRNQQALEAYSKVEQIYRKLLGVEHSHYAIALNNLAVVEASLGKLDDAEKAYSKVLDIYTKLYRQNHPYVGITLFNLGDIEFQKKDFPQAKQLFQKAAQIFKESEGSTHQDYTKSLVHIALVEAAEGDLEAAKRNLLSAMQIQEGFMQKYHPMLATTYSRLASISEDLGEKKAAFVYYKKMIENYEHQIQYIFPSLTEQEKLAFYQEIKARLDVFSFFALGYAIEDPEVAQVLFDVSIFTKGLLLASVSKMQNSILETGNAEAISKYYAWKNKKELLTKKFYLDRNEAEKRREEFEKLEREISSLEKELSLLSNIPFSTQKIKWKDLQTRLTPKEAVVEMIYVRYRVDSGKDSVLYAVLVLQSQSPPQLVSLPNGSYLENMGYRYYRNTITHKTTDTLSYAAYWKPMENALMHVETIYWLPDGVYNKMNPYSFYSPKEEKYLVDKYQIYTLSDGIALTHKEKKATTSPTLGNMCLFGFPEYYGNTEETNSAMASDPTQDSLLLRSFNNAQIPPLPGTKMEVQQIAAICLRKKCTAQVFIGSAASESGLKKVRNADILHVATHGFFQEQEEVAEQEDTRSFSGVRSEDLKNNPLLRSGLLLANAGTSIQGKGSSMQENGILTAYEAANLHLENTQLVVLSACETGLGEISKGEGVMGLQRAFQLAGAHYVIMSLWKVDDKATSQLMTSFYEYLFVTKNVLEAFKLAQQELKKQYPDPIFWAAFVLTGL